MNGRFRVLVVDDEPDIRKVTERSLARDAALSVRCCGSGQQALVEAAQWAPHLILLDVMMPFMDGPTTLARLRDDPSTSQIPVVFLTARASSQDLDYVTSLGAAGSIAKPFEPKELREAVRRHLEAPPSVADPQPDELSLAATDKERDVFRTRLRSDAVTLNELRERLGSESGDPADLKMVRDVVHKLAGAGGIFGFDGVSRSAAALERSIVDLGSGQTTLQSVAGKLDDLVDTLRSNASAHSQT